MSLLGGVFSHNPCYNGAEKKHGKSKTRMIQHASTMGSTRKFTKITIIKIGKVILCFCWAAMCGVTLFALDSQAQQRDKDKVRSVKRDDASICVELTELAERTRRFPKGLLYAIARVESGRTRADGGGTTPWPWTVTVGGDGRYYENKQQAVRVVEQMQRDGRSNIDVGCMQVNLYHHGGAFRTIAEALDPVNNVAYATEYLVVLYKRYNNWEEAIKHYHSSDPTKHDHYLKRVKRAWEKARAPSGSAGATGVVRTQKKAAKDTAVLSREEASKLEREALLLSDDLRKKLGIVEELLPKNATEPQSVEAPPSNAQNLNAGFFLDLIDEPL